MTGLKPGKKKHALEHILEMEGMSSISCKWDEGSGTYE